MEGFDDKEQEKLSKSLSEKLDSLRKDMASITPEKWQELEETLNTLGEQMDMLQEKAKFGTITDLEIGMMDEVFKTFEPIRQQVEDSRLLLQHSKTKSAIAIYNAIKEEAEKGNEAAQKAYDQLRPLYQQMLKSDTDENRN